LRDLSSQGHCLDSPARQKYRVEFHDCDNPAFQAQPAELQEFPMREIYFRDEINYLFLWLQPPDQLIVSDLDEGFSEQEIAARMGMSQPCVSKHRKVILETARRLGLLPSHAPRRVRTHQPLL